MSQFVKAFGLAVVLAAGCSSGGGNVDSDIVVDMSGAAPDLTASGGDLAMGLAFDEFKTSLSTAACKFLYSCCKPAELMGISFAGTSQMDCNTKFFDASNPGCVMDVAKGLVTFDAVAGQKCLEAVMNATCAGGLDQLMAPCASFLVSNEVVGQKCGCSSSTGGGCKNGYCDQGGACAAYSPDCATTLCDPATSYCNPNGTVCEPYLAEGADCSMAANGCDPSKDYCAATMKCAALLADGADCSMVQAGCKSGDCDQTTKKCVTPNLCTGM